MAYYRIRPRWRDHLPGAKVLPATEALRVLLPDGVLGHIDIYELDSPFVEYIRRLNIIGGSEKPWRYIATPNSGIFNYTRNNAGEIDREWYENGRRPFLNTVGFDGNVVNVMETIGGLALIESIDVNKYVPLFTYQDRPDLVHQFTSVNNRNRLFKAGRGLTVYCPLLTRFPSVLPIDLLEPFPKLPARVAVEWPAGLNARKSPTVNSLKITAHPQGKTLTIFGYYPRGAEVWAKALQGYICLYTPTQKNPFSTTWRMQVHSPPL